MLYTTQPSNKILIRGPSHYLTPQKYCCGASTLGRLRSSTISLGCIRDNLKRAMKDRVTPVFSEQHGWQKNWTVDTMVRKFNSEIRDHNTKELPSCSYFALDQEDSFIALIETLGKSSPQALYLMTDNIEGVGDVHTGPYSTKHFAQWLGRMGIVGISTPGPVKSTRTGAEIQGWVANFPWESRGIKEPIADLRDRVINAIKEINNSDAIKENYQRERSKDAKLNGELRTKLSGW